VARIEHAPYGYDVYLWEGDTISVFTDDVAEVFRGHGEAEFENFLNLEHVKTKLLVS
jgi:hypothetical protein